MEIVSDETTSPDSEGAEEGKEELAERRAKTLIAGSRRPIVGHVISIAQSIVGATQAQPERPEVDNSVEMSQDVSSDNEGGVDDSLDLGEGQQNQQQLQPTLVKTVLTDAGVFEEWNSFVETNLQQVLDRQDSYVNVDNNDISTDSTKMSQMEAALEALALQDSAWMKQNDDDIQNNVFDDDDDDSDDDDDYSDDEDDYHNYGQSNFSSHIKVTAVIKDEGSPDKNMVDFEDDEFEIGDQFANNASNFADFGTSDNSNSFSFEANFDNAPQANFGADFDSPQFDPSPNFEANFDNVQVGDDLFADFANEAFKEATPEDKGKRILLISFRNFNYFLIYFQMIS